MSFKTFCMVKTPPNFQALKNNGIQRKLNSRIFVFLFYLLEVKACNLIMEVFMFNLTTNLVLPLSCLSTYFYVAVSVLLAIFVQ